LIEIQPETKEYTSLAMYTHPNGEKEWRKCKIISKIGNRNSIDSSYKIEFEHEKNPEKPNTNFYLYSRENVLVSFDYKATPSYFNSDIRKIVAKFGTDERLITHVDAFDFEDNKPEEEQLDWKTPGEVEN
jgi:hypothetical protein